MKLYTSYYAKYRILQHCVAISNSVPPGYKGRHLKNLSPPWDLVQGYKDGDISQVEFESRYLKYIEALGDISGLFREGDVLLCWESPSKFCHRHLLGHYLQDKYGFEVTEL